MSAAPAETPAEPVRAPDTVIYPKAPAEEPKPVVPHDGDGGRSLIVGVAFLMAGAGAWILFQRRKAGPLGGKGLRKLQIEETRPLGSRQYLVVADYEGKKFLLGVTPGQIQMLTPLDGDVARTEAKI